MGGIRTPASSAPSSAAYDDFAALLALVADPNAAAARLNELRQAEETAQARAAEIIAEAEQLRVAAETDRAVASNELAEARATRAKARTLLEAAVGAAPTPHTEAKE